MNQIDILNQIKELQVKKDSEHFHRGMFPSFRENTVLRIKRPDDNIFFSASVLYVLKSVYSYLPEDEKKIVNEIEAELIPNFSLYTNKPERNSFNFWQKKKNKHFPNGKILNRLSKFQLPDDIDTTSLIQMVGGFSEEKAKLTKEALVRHVNGYRKVIKNGHRQLSKYGAYSTWFGKNMPIEFDVCVLSNYLLWVNHFQFGLNEHDKQTIALLEETIEQALFYKSSFKSAPEYPRLAVVLYHLARLASQTTYLDKVKNQLIKHCWNQYNSTNISFEKKILESSLLKLGEELNTNNFNNKDNTYWWFTAGLLSVYSNSIIERIAPHSLFHFRFTCPAFNLTLLLENKVLSELR